MLPLGSLARIDYGLGANVVNSEDVSRLIVVSSNVNGRPLGSVVGDIQKVIGPKSKFPAATGSVMAGSSSPRSAPPQTWCSTACWPPW